MSNILDRYFELSDRASFDEVAFQQLVDLFSEEAEIQPSGASKVYGKPAIADLYKIFFQMYGALQRVWKTSVTEHGLEAAWAIAGQRDNGEFFAMQGIHIAQLDREGKILNLEVKVASS